MPRALLDACSPCEHSEEIQSRACFSLAKATLLRGEGRYAEALASARAATQVRPELGIRSSSAMKAALVEEMEAACVIDRGGAERLLAELEGLQPGETTPHLWPASARSSPEYLASRTSLPPSLSSGSAPRPSGSRSRCSSRQSCSCRSVARRKRVRACPRSGRSSSGSRHVPGSIVSLRSGRPRPSPPDTSTAVAPAERLTASLIESSEEHGGFAGDAEHCAAGEPRKSQTPVLGGCYQMRHNGWLPG